MHAMFVAAGQTATEIGSALLYASVHGGVVATAAWVGLWFARSTPPWARAAVWWLVAARFVLCIVPGSAVDLPILPEAQAVVSAAGMAVGPQFLHTPAPDGRDKSAPTPAPPMDAASTNGSHQFAPPAARTSVPLATLGWLLLVGTWLALLARQTLRDLRDALALRRLVAESEPADEILARRAAVIAARCGLMQAPVLRLHPSIRSPLVTHPRRPVVLLPTAATNVLSAHELDLALAHEFAHLRRRDLWWAWVPAVAQRVFAWHPLARLAVREYLIAREAACDAEAIRSLDSEPFTYGRLLLKLGIARPAPISSLAGAATTATILKRRLAMLDHRSAPVTIRGAVAAVAAATLAVVPWTLSARVAVPTPTGDAPFHLAVTDTAAAPAIEGVVNQDPPPPPPAPKPPVPPPPPPPPPDGGAFDADSPWVLFPTGSTDAHVNAGRRTDVDEARRARQGDEALLWFRKDGQAYIIRDEALIAQVRTSFARVDTTAARMEEMGSRLELVDVRMSAQVGEQSGRMAAIGAQQGSLGARMARLTGELLVLEGQRLQEGAGATGDPSHRAAMDRVRAEMDEVRREMEHLGQQQEKLGDQLRAHGDELRAQGQQLEALGGVLQREVADAQRAVKGLLDEAVSSGRAQPVR
jgi:bla regulator protein blaR1